MQSSSPIWLNLLYDQVPSHFLLSDIESPSVCHLPRFKIDISKLPATFGKYIAGEARKNVYSSELKLKESVQGNSNEQKCGS